MPAQENLRKSPLNVFLAAGVAMVLGACASEGQPFGSAAGITPVAEGEERIVFGRKAFPAGPARHVKYLTPFSREDYALYQDARGLKGGGAQAEVVYASTGDGLEDTVLDVWFLTDDSVESWNVFRGKTISFGKPELLDGRLEILVQPFTVAEFDRSCFGFLSEFDKDVSDPATRYDKLLFGYYCPPTGVRLSTREISEIAFNIGVLGETEYRPAGGLGGARLQRISDTMPTGVSSGVPVNAPAGAIHVQELYVAVRDGFPAGENGNADYPYDFLTFFSESDSVDR